MPRNIAPPPPAADEILSRHCAGTFPSPVASIVRLWRHHETTRMQGFRCWSEDGGGFVATGWESGYTYM